ncbi:MAG: CDP-glycerol glycerophosphotransferase family protein [Lachnospiraceae bacterium]|nr:CDP-glycerol glycerophosphotransferase family protein [Lachnospiraceae bacterium]
MSQEKIVGFQIKEEIAAVWKTMEDGKIVYEIRPSESQKIGEIEFLLTSEQSVGNWSQGVTILEKREDRILFQVELGQVFQELFWQYAEKQVTMKWKTYIKTKVEGEDYLYRLTDFAVKQKMEEHEDEKLYKMDFMFGNIIGNMGEYEVVPYCTVYGRMGLKLGRKSARYTGTIINKVTDVSIKKEHLRIQFQYQTIENCEPTNVLIKLRNSKEVDEMSYSLPIENKGKKGKWNLAEAHLNLAEVKLRALYWDTYLEYRSKEGDVFQTKLKNYSPKFVKKQFMSFWRDDTYSFGDNEIFYPYMTTTDALAFQCREKGEYDGLSFRIKERIAAGVYYLFKKHWQGMKIHLVYEKFCMMAQDNGYYFFKYCMDNDMEKKMDRSIYYVMDKNSPDMDKLAPYKKNVVQFMSIRYIVYLLASKLLISTDTRTHAYAWRRKNSIIFQYMDSKKLVFLQHGVTALKKVDFLYGRGKNGDCSLFVVTSDYEKNIVGEHFGYREKEIAVSGFARWDVLHDKSAGSNEILLMPTWRNWLEEVGDDIFRQSDYYKNYMELLTSQRLTDLLEKNDLKLNFYLHPKFRDYIKDFKIDSKRIRLIPFGEEPLNELMMKCRMLVTDYSSVCWDVYYQGKPVIFYQFDLDDYYQLHGSYLNMRKDLFGPQVETLSELFEAWEKTVESGFQLEPQYEAMRKSYFKYIDDDNSRRICDAILEKGW